MATDNLKKPPPVVLCFGGHDPSGGAGVQADIEAIAAGNCHAVPIITALTVQDSGQVYRYQSVDPELLLEQTTRVVVDMSPAAIKVGMLGSNKALQVVANLAAQLSLLPLVVDPVLAAGFGGSLGDDGIVAGILRQLIPLATLVTPNTEELIALTGELDPKNAAEKLLATGCDAVLVTGTHADTHDVTNTLYRHNQPPLSQDWPRLPHSYHGSGCTLASAITARLARGIALESAVMDAQSYTWNSLKNGNQLGKGQWIPRRVGS